MVFCPTGRSSNILATLGPELRLLAATGAVSAQMMADMQNITLIKSRSAGIRIANRKSLTRWVLGIVAALSLVT